LACGSGENQWFIVEERSWEERFIMDKSEVDRIARACTRWLGGHHRDRMMPHRMLASVVASVGEAVAADVYGRGSLISDFETEVAQLLGKESAVFMPSGTMAQQIALRIWSDRRHSPHVAFHPTSHLEIHEQKGYQLLHGLHGVLVGPATGLMGLPDLDAVAEPLAALLLELPQREIGGALPAWGDLIAMLEWARLRGVFCHLDGARLWECRPFYQRPYSEIAGLFDSVYVSFYKILGGIAGAALAGPADFIAEARIWQRRHGGNLVQLYPYVLSARMGLRERLDRMEVYRDKAVEIASTLTSVPGIRVTPDPPQTNMMHVYLSGSKERLETAALEISREIGLWLFHPLRASAAPGQFMFELSVGDAALDLTTSEIAAAFRDLMRRAEAGADAIS
jgi:threonine aldolase